MIKQVFSVFYKLKFTLLALALPLIGLYSFVLSTGEMPKGFTF